MEQNLQEIAHNQVISLSRQVRNKKENFRGGKLQYFIQNWEKITSDRTILSWVRGIHIDYNPDIRQLFVLPQRSFTNTENEFINNKVQELLQQGVIEHSLHEEGEIISTIFLVEKKDGGFCLILNLIHVLDHSISCKP